MHIRNFLISLNETETNIFGIMLILTIGTIHELIVYIKKQITKRKERTKKQKEICSEISKYLEKDRRQILQKFYWFAQKSKRLSN